MLSLYELKILWYLLKYWDPTLFMQYVTYDTTIYSLKNISNSLKSFKLTASITDQFPF